MAWWPFRGPSGAPRDDDASTAGRASLEAAVHSLRTLMTAERHRLRPDSRDLAWTITERAAEYGPAWARVSAQRPAEAQELLLLLSHGLEPALRDFLDLPDSQKPRHADELHGRLSELQTEAQRLGRRLTRALSSRLRARGEL